jgi:PAS domain S-box-containing protein
MKDTAVEKNKGNLHSLTTLHKNDLISILKSKFNKTLKGNGQGESLDKISNDFINNISSKNTICWLPEFSSKFMKLFKKNTDTVEMYMLFVNSYTQYMTTMINRYPSKIDMKEIEVIYKKIEDINHIFLNGSNCNCGGETGQVNNECGAGLDYIDYNITRLVCCGEAFDNILKSISMMYCIVDKDGNIEYVSKGIEQLLGYTVNEPEGKDLFKKSKDELKKVKAALKEASKKGVAEFKSNIISKQNIKKKLLVKVTPLFVENKKNLYILIFADLPFRKELALELKRSREELQQMFDAITDPLFVVDKDMKILRMNKFLKEKLSVKKYKEILGKNADKIKYEGNALCSKTELKKALADGDVHFSEMYSEDEKKFYLQYIYPIKDSEESDTLVKSALVYKKDMTRHKMMEEEILHLERLAVLGRLSAIVAHEIRNPLSGIGLSASLLKKKLKEDWRSHDSLNNILDGIGKIESVILRLLDFSKPKKMLKRKVNIVDTIKEALFFVRPKALKRSLEIIEDYPDSVPNVLVDPDQITQVFINLLLNAIQSIKETGVIVIKVSVSKRKVIIKLTDTGEGIKKDDLVHIFEPFFTTRPEGTGLGLAISKNILMQNDIDISVESKAGAGTAFTLMIKAHYEI